jgi:hypothetical protein
VAENYLAKVEEAKESLKRHFVENYMFTEHQQSNPLPSPLVLHLAD